MQTSGGDITENLQVLYSYSNLYSMLMMREKLLKMNSKLPSKVPTDIVVVVEEEVWRGG